METAPSSSTNPPQEPRQPLEDRVFKTKTVQFLGRRTPIVLQEHNGPCGLIAICNVLLLRNEIHLSLGTSEVSQKTLLSLVAGRLIDSNSNRDDDVNQQQNLAGAFDVLNKLATGIDVNVKFNRIDDFERTQECAIFDLLGIPLYHGWIVDPKDYDTANAIGSKSYNDLTVEIVTKNIEIHYKNNLEEDCVDYDSTMEEDCVDSDSTMEEDCVDIGSSHSVSDQLGRRGEEAEVLRALKLSEAYFKASISDPVVGHVNGDGGTVSVSVDEDMCNKLVKTVDSDQLRRRGDIEEAAEVLRAFKLSEAYFKASISDPVVGHVNGDGGTVSVSVDEDMGNKLVKTVDSADKLGKSARAENNDFHESGSSISDDCAASGKDCNEHASSASTAAPDLKAKDGITPKQGELITSFLIKNASQLTSIGLSSLQDGLKEHELCVFFRNNHFSTMFKFEGDLYLLVTDQGYINEPNLVWEKLNEVNGDSWFMTSSFKEFKDYLASLDGAIQENLDINAALQFEINFPQQESEKQPPRHNFQQPVNGTSKLVTGLQVNMDLDGVDDPMDTAGNGVTREIDVFFKSADPNTKLYVLQYPLRPFQKPYELDERCQKVRLNLDSSEVEFDLEALDIEKQTLYTLSTPPPESRFAVGILIGDKLHLHPIHAIVQLRHVEGSRVVKSAATSKKKQKQHWVPLKYHGCNSDISSGFLQEMMAQSSETPINFTMSGHDYVTALCGGVIPKGTAKRFLLSLPLEERLKKLLIQGPPLRRFNTIKHFAPEWSDLELLEHLQSTAVLLWGHWAPRSQLLFAESPSGHLARDYVISLFSDKLKVFSSDVNVDFESELGKNVGKFLKIFGLERCDLNKTTSEPLPYWMFKELPDYSFIESHSDVVQMQQVKLRDLKDHVSRKVADYIPKSANSGPQVASLDGVPPRNMTMSKETQSALRFALGIVFKTRKVCRFESVCNELRKMVDSKDSNMPHSYYKVVEAAASLDCPEHELKAVMSEDLWLINDYCVLKSNVFPFRDLVIEMFRQKGLDASLKKAELGEAEKWISRTEYYKVMHELCVFKGKSSGWVLKSPLPML
ncbi:uncharacterized protein LOC130740742 isoform X2 [Lotus japonicus]|uniref:uncharacterized protein LOC130740742 isoform X2 n=1 Tax=Lotus japonicus TaxID=34305 RepID=UPI00258F10CB|nr:uncharacterized protein LOC130740742 isoform X2 [Lotus japonicus]